MKLFGSIAAISAIAITGTLAAVAAPTPAKHGNGVKAEPGIFDPENTGLVVGQWGNGGVDGGPGVLLAKIEPTGANAAGQVEFKGVSGKTLTTIGFDIRTDTDCGGGAPRFNVVTEEDPGTTHFFGCNSSGTTAMTDVGAPFTDTAGHEWQTKVADLAAAGIDGQTIDSLEIVHDEEGASIIDNIVVNGTTISKPSKKK
jgi:hypothetical protein